MENYWAWDFAKTSQTYVSRERQVQTESNSFLLGLIYDDSMRRETSIWLNLEKTLGKVNIFILEWIKCSSRIEYISTPNRNGGTHWIKHCEFALHRQDKFINYIMIESLSSTRILFSWFGKIDGQTLHAIDLVFMQLKNKQKRIERKRWPSIIIKPAMN